MQCMQLRPEITHKVVMSPPVPHLLLYHVRTDGVDPFGVTGDFCNGNVGFVEPGRRRRKGEEQQAKHGQKEKEWPLHL